MLTTHCPCQGCVPPDRHVGCRNTCGKWAGYEIKANEEREYRMKISREKNAMYDYSAETYRRKTECGMRRYNQAKQQERIENERRNCERG